MADKTRGYIEGVLQLVDLVGPKHPCSPALAAEALRVMSVTPPKGGDAQKVLVSARLGLNPYSGDTPADELAGVEEVLAVIRLTHPSIGKASSLLADIYLRLPLETIEESTEPGLESTIDAGVSSDTLENAEGPDASIHPLRT